MKYHQPAPASSYKTHHQITTNQPSVDHPLAIPNQPVFRNARVFTDPPSGSKTLFSQNNSCAWTLPWRPCLFFFLWLLVFFLAALSQLVNVGESGMALSCLTTTVHSNHATLSCFGMSYVWCICIHTSMSGEEKNYLEIRACLRQLLWESDLGLLSCLLLFLIRILLFPGIKYMQKAVGLLTTFHAHTHKRKTKKKKKHEDKHDLPRHHHFDQLKEEQ